MIAKKDYLKNLNDMTSDEKLLLLDRIDKWMEAYPSLCASFTSWEDAPVKDFDEGVLLCSCFRRALSFVENAYYFNAQKCLDMIRETLEEIVRIARPGGPRTETEKKENPIKAFVPKKPEPDEDGIVNRITEPDRQRMEKETVEEEEAKDTWRPQNLSGYIHLLSPSMQKECMEVKTKYYLPLREYRSRLESLAENPNATQEQRAEMAQKLTAVEESLAKFWNRVDEEYKKMTGHGIPDENVKEKKMSEFTKEDIDRISDEETREKQKAARIENNKKYLRRVDLPDCEETRNQLYVRATEMMEWGVKITARQMNNMQKFGVNISELQ